LIRIIVEEFKNYHNYKIFFNIFSSIIKIEDLILLSNLTYLKSVSVADDIILADYGYYEDYNGILLLSEKNKYGSIIDYLSISGNIDDKIINNEIQFISMKLSKKIIELFFEEKFMELSELEQNTIINREIKELEYTYDISLSQKYFFEKGIIISETEQNQINNQNIIPNSLYYNNIYSIENITKINKIDNEYWIKIKINQNIENLNGSLSLREKDNANKYQYYDISKIDRKENNIYYLTLIKEFTIDINKTYDLISSSEVISIDQDLSNDNIYIINLDTEVNLTNNIITLEEYNNTNNLEASTPDKLYYIKEITKRELSNKQYNIYGITLTLNSDKKYRLSIRFKKLGNIYFLFNLKVLDNLYFLSEFNVNVIPYILYCLLDNSLFVISFI
jgi:hypothetical protein